MSAEIMAVLNSVMDQRTRHCGNEYLVYIRSATKQVKNALNEKEIPYAQRTLRSLVEEWVLDKGGVPFDVTILRGSPGIVYSIKRKGH